MCKISAIHHSSDGRCRDSHTYSLAPDAYFALLHLTSSSSRSPLSLSCMLHIFSLCLSVAGSSGNLSAQIPLPSLQGTHTRTRTHTDTHIIGGETNYSRTGKLFCLVHPCLLSSPPPSSLYRSHPLSPTNRWGILMKSALPVPICVRNEFHQFLNEGIYKSGRLQRREPPHCTKSLFLLLTLRRSCTYCGSAACVCS